MIIHAIPQDAFVAALKDPNTMMISDGLTLMDALRRMTLMPARRRSCVTAPPLSRVRSPARIHHQTCGGEGRESTERHTNLLHTRAK